jgi:hypothetical protein
MDLLTADADFHVYRWQSRQTGTLLVLCDKYAYPAHIRTRPMMAKIKVRSSVPRRSPTASMQNPASKSMRSRGASVAAGATAALEDARQAGLLEGEKTAHVSFRAPPALVEAAKRESGVSSVTELGILALAMLAQPDPVAAFLKRTRGRLGEAHTLEY